MAVHPHAARGSFDLYMNNHYFDFLEAVLEQREKTLSEIAHDVYTETGSYFAVASIFCFLKRNRLRLKARLHRRFLSLQLNATQCNFCRAELATSCDFIAILVQFVSVNVSTRLLLKQQLCAC